MGLNPADVLKMKERLERNHRPRPVVTAPAPARPAPVVQPPAVDPSVKSIIFANLDEFDMRQFTYRGAPMGAPRMTQRDRFRKRPVVVRYHAFKDGIRAAAGPLPPEPELVLVAAHVAMPGSWSKNKMTQLNGKPHRQRPDWDNIGKAVCDALFEEDCCVWLGMTMKHWCYAGEERVDVKVFYAKSK